ncbi:MAG: hypothetical protein Fur005_31620 [Roseiflexaceae bacterium]
MQPSSPTDWLTRVRQSPYWVLWPLLLFALAQLMLLNWVGYGWPLATLPVGVAVLVLLSGLLPALFRPSVATMLVGCSALALANVLGHAPPQIPRLPTELDRIAVLLNTPLARINLINAVLIAPFTLHLVSVFPMPNALGRRWIISYYLLIVALLIMVIIAPLTWQIGLLIALLASTYAGFVLAILVLWRTIQRAQPAEPRIGQQARVLLLSLIMAEAPLLFLPLVQFVQVLIPYELFVGAQIVLPLGIAYAILRQDLFGLDAALRRTLDYTLVSFGLLVIYFGLTALLTQMSRQVGGTWGLFATILSVVVSAAAFPPLRRIAQRVVDRLFYPERLYFGQAVAAARRTLTQVVEREQVVALLERDLPQQLGTTWAKLVLRPAFEQPAQAHDPGVWTTLLMVAGQPIGSYWLGPRHSGVGYASDEQEQLQGVTQQAALALAYAETIDRVVQLNLELEERVAIRTAHVLAQQRELAMIEERQRLARDLHDSVKQALFSLGIGLRTARNRVRTEPDSAIRLLEQQEQVALAAQAELGTLLSHLRSEASGSADLVVLISDHLAWLEQQHGMQVEAQLPPAVVLPEPLPRELMLIIRESFHNILRHSGQLKATLMVTSTTELLTVTISDQGQGFDPLAATQGYGLQSMRERLALLGGRYQLQTTPGRGTTLWFQIDQPALQ